MSSSNPERQRREKRAQRQVLKGQLDKAVQAYRQMAESDPTDKRIRHKLAELLERQGDRAGALQTWMRLGKSYSKGDFSQQAVSVYKHVIQIDPNNIETRLRLAEEFVKLGFVLDAVDQLLESAARLERVGSSTELVPVYRRLVELQPQNVDYRLRLAQLLAKTKQTGMAAEMLAQTALELGRARRTQEFIFWGERALRLESLNVELLNALARLYMSQGNLEQAMQKLEPSLRADPYNIETLWLLASLFHRDRQPGKIRLIHRRLSELCEQQGNPPGLRAVVARVERLLPSHRPAQKPILIAPANAPVRDLTDQDDIPEIGSAEFFMLEDRAGPDIRLSRDFSADLPEIPPEEFIMLG